MKEEEANFRKCIGALIWRQSMFVRKSIRNYKHTFLPATILRLHRPIHTDTFRHVAFSQCSKIYFKNSLVIVALETNNALLFRERILREIYIYMHTYIFFYTLDLC